MWLATATRPWQPPMDAHNWASSNGGSTRLVRGELVDADVDPPEWRWPPPAPDDDEPDERAH